MQSSQLDVPLATIRDSETLARAREFDRRPQGELLSRVLSPVEPLRAFASQKGNSGTTMETTVATVGVGLMDKVLIVEDSRPMQRALQRALNAEGYHVDIAS